MTDVLTLATYDSTTVQVGDLVAEEVITCFRNALIPATDWTTLFQAGGAVCDRITKDGRLHPAYSTFKRIAEGVWRYCGSCLRGETAERGDIPKYEK